MNIVFSFLISKIGIIKTYFPDLYSDLEKKELEGNEAVCNEQIVDQTLREKLSQATGWELAKNCPAPVTEFPNTSQDALGSL